jgi:hypothetical protein
MRHNLSSFSIRQRGVRAIVATLAILCGGLISMELANADSPSPAPPTKNAEAAIVASSTLVMHSELEGLGIHVRRKRLDTPGASLTLEITVDDNAAAGHFVQDECIVLRDTEGMKDLVTTDASADSSDKIARRNSSDKTDTTFLVLGREIERSYLVFEFSNTGKPDQRYLLPVAAVPKRHS